MTKYDTGEGISFEQTDDGGVRIVDDGVVRVEMDKSIWASVIAGMSYYGEEDYGFYRALNFHTGEPMGPTTPPNLSKLKPLTAAE